MASLAFEVWEDFDRQEAVRRASAEAAREIPRIHPIHAKRSKKAKLVEGVRPQDEDEAHRSAWYKRPNADRKKLILVEKAGRIVKKETREEADEVVKIDSHTGVYHASFQYGPEQAAEEARAAALVRRLQDRLTTRAEIEEVFSEHEPFVEGLPDRYFVTDGTGVFLYDHQGELLEPGEIGGVYSRELLALEANRLRLQTEVRAYPLDLDIPLDMVQ